MKVLLTASILLLGLSASAALGDSARSDTLDFGKSDDCAAAYKKFQSRTVPVFFAVSEDAKLCVYAFCSAACRRSSARSLTTYRCEKESGNSCQVYGPSESVPGVTEY